MQRLRILAAAFSVVGCVTAYGLAQAASKKEVEDYIHEPMPPGFQVLISELEGAVFTDAAGHTLYTWPSQSQRNGYIGDTPGKSECNDVHYRETAGVPIPYPAGLELPHADTRPTCIQHWPPALASADAKPVGNFSTITRADGKKQWAYKEYPLYTSHLDQRPGETNGGTSRGGGYGSGGNGAGKDPNSSGAQRNPAKPAPVAPAQFGVATMHLGRLLVTNTRYSVYSYDGDTATKVSCVGDCLKDWEPILAPSFAVAGGDWSTVERPGGRKQWAFRGKPLYKFLKDTKMRAMLSGATLPGWHNVFVQRSPEPPKGFHPVDTDAGEVLADAHGKTIYFYQCTEDTPDTLFCDAPDSAQEYRWAMCGNGDVDVCNKTFPYMIADKSAKSDSIAWSIRDIDPKSGRYVAEGAPGSLHIWTFRGRPIYTFAGDKEPGDIVADGWGEAFGQKNGFSAYWVRDLFFAQSQID